MYWLISLVLFFLFFSGKKFIRSLYTLFDAQKRGKQLDGVLGQKRQCLQNKRTECDLLKSEYENAAAIYEVTKDISRTLNREKVFRTFRKIVRSFVDIDDCRLLSALMRQKPTMSVFVSLSPSDVAMREYSLFPLTADDKYAGVLAVRGLQDRDRNKLATLANQLALVIRRADLYQTVQELSITDSLTQVLLRRHCIRRLREEIARSRMKHFNLSCLMFDIDNFKYYNDKFGHLFGDIVLCEVVRIIRDNIREIDLLGRFGGEEFLLVLPETDKQAALVVAERIRADINDKEICAYDEILKATVSIGTSSFPEDGERYKELLDKSDQALYRAKQAGKNRVASCC
ncbi:MAG: diguanylate cyclase [Candidatus Omnitrophota bacterium]